MIKEIVYKGDVTIIKGANESIMTDELNLTDAFDFAKKNKAKFYKTSSTLEDLQDFSTYLAYKITKAPNRNIYLYFRKLYEAGINDILNMDSFIRRCISYNHRRLQRKETVLHHRMWGDRYIYNQNIKWLFKSNTK